MTNLCSWSTIWRRAVPRRLLNQAHSRGGASPKPKSYLQMCSSWFSCCCCCGIGEYCCCLLAVSFCLLHQMKREQLVVPKSHNVLFLCIYAENLLEEGNMLWELRAWNNDPGINGLFSTQPWFELHSLVCSSSSIDVGVNLKVMYSFIGLRS